MRNVKRVTHGDTLTENECADPLAFTELFIVSQLIVLDLQSIKLYFKYFGPVSSLSSF